MSPLKLNFQQANAQTLSSPSSFRLMTSRSKSVLKPLVRLKVILPVRPSQWAWWEMWRGCGEEGGKKKNHLSRHRLLLCTVIPQSRNPCFWHCNLHSYPGVYTHCDNSGVWMTQRCYCSSGLAIGYNVEWNGLRVGNNFSICPSHTNHPNAALHGNKGQRFHLSLDWLAIPDVGVWDSE